MEDVARRGPVQILCEEIRFDFSPEMERPEILIAFCRQLFGEVSGMIAWRSVISRGFKQEGFSTLEAMKPLKAVEKLLNQFPMPPGNRERMCGELHNGLLYQPDDGPCNRFIEMLSGIVSAIRFGPGEPYRSRHAAAAAQYIWKHKYGVTLFDECTSDWEKDWTRRMLAKALKAHQHLRKDKIDGTTQAD